MRGDLPHGAGAPVAPRSLSLERWGRLRGAGRWARITAILGFMLAGVSALLVPLMSLGAGASATIADAAEGALFRLFLGINAIACIGTACLLLNYRSRLFEGLGGYAAAFAKAFRSLRHALIVWTALSIVSLLYTLYSLGKGP